MHERLICCRRDETVSLLNISKVTLEEEQTKTMAIELIEDISDKSLTVKISGKLSAEDDEILEPGVEALIESSGKIRSCL